MGRNSGGPKITDLACGDSAPVNEDKKLGETLKKKKQEPQFHKVLKAMSRTDDKIH